MLADPTNPAMWADGTERSQNNAFDIAASFYRIDTRKMQHYADCRTRSAQYVADARAEGKNLSVHALLKCKKAPKPKAPHGGAYTRGGSPT